MAHCLIMEVFVIAQLHECFYAVFYRSDLITFMLQLVIASKISILAMSLSRMQTPFQLASDVPVSL